MTDEQLRKEKFLCVHPLSNGITICDLIIKATNPVYNRHINIKQGEYILTELLDFEDLKKSRLTGALSKFIQMGWITVENPSIPSEKKEVITQGMHVPTSTSKGITEAQATGLIEKVEMIPAAPSSDIGYPDESHPKVIELLSSEQSRKPNSLAISEIDSASTAASVEEAFDKFNSLRYFQKLKVIKETADVRLLESIAARSNYPQLIHNAKNRVRALSKGR